MARKHHNCVPTASICPFGRHNGHSANAHQYWRSGLPSFPDRTPVIPRDSNGTSWLSRRHMASITIIAHCCQLAVLAVVALRRRTRRYCIDVSQSRAGTPTPHGARPATPVREIASSHPRTTATDTYGAATQLSRDMFPWDQSA